MPEHSAGTGEVTVVQASCVGGVVKPPTVTPASGPTGVSYTVAPPGPYDGNGEARRDGDGEVDVGVQLVTDADGWTRVDVTTATYEVTLKVTTCDAVVPVDPSVTRRSVRGVDGADVDVGGDDGDHLYDR